MRRVRNPQLSITGYKGEVVYYAKSQKDKTILVAKQNNRSSKTKQTKNHRKSLRKGVGQIEFQITCISLIHISRRVSCDFQVFHHRNHLSSCLQHSMFAGT